MTKLISYIFPLHCKLGQSKTVLTSLPLPWKERGTWHCSCSGLCNTSRSQIFRSLALHSMLSVGYPLNPERCEKQHSWIICVHTTKGTKRVTLTMTMATTRSRRQTYSTVPKDKLRQISKRSIVTPCDQCNEHFTRGVVPSPLIKGPRKTREGVGVVFEST